MSIRIRPPDDFDPPRFTVEWHSAGFGAGMWAVLRNGKIVSFHDWRWQARRARKRLASAPQEEPV